MERGDGGDTGLGSEWHTGAMARGLFLARFVWKSGFPSPPSRIFTWGGRGRGGQGRVGMGEGRPFPSPTGGALPHPGSPFLERGCTPTPGRSPRSPPVPSYWSVRRRSSGWNMQCPAVPGSGPGSRHQNKLLFPHFPASLLPRAYPCPKPWCKLCVASIRGARTVDAVCTVFLVEDLSPEICGLLLLYPRKG